MKIDKKDEKVIIKGVKDFDLVHTFECGQCFRWNQEKDKSYTGVACGKVINIQKRDDELLLDHTTEDEVKNFWVDYLDLKRDYGEIKDCLKTLDDPMKNSVEYGEGIHILHQDEWETLISFIISSNRGIPLIKKSIEKLCERYGDYITTYRGKDFYAFPKPHQLLNKTVDEIKMCHTGYRARYIVDTAAVVAEKQIKLYKIKNLSTEEGRKCLLRFSGVGPKVADCILLFSMNKYDAFPIDVWVKRVMEYFYCEEGIPMNQLQAFAKHKFGAYAGFAQQYLFYYARALGIGKK